LDLFCGEGGAAVGYRRAGFDVLGVDTDPARLARYPFPTVRADALEYAAELAGSFAVVHASPTCTGYSRGTAAVPDRLTRYDRLIAATRDVLEHAGVPFVIENVTDARPELRAPILLCGRQFGLTTVDDDGTPLVMDRHRLFESTIPLSAPPHPRHRRDVQVAGSYGGARRDKVEARLVRQGGYVPGADVQRRLLGVPWMSERGAMLSIPPAYTEWIGRQLMDRMVLAGWDTDAGTPMWRADRDVRQG
jgi:DNA (cytosine-5)-methyltransferase 1